MRLQLPFKFSATSSDAVIGSRARPSFQVRSSRSLSSRSSSSMNEQQPTAASR